MEAYKIRLPRIGSGASKDSLGRSDLKKQTLIGVILGIRPISGIDSLPFQLLLGMSKSPVRPCTRYSLG